MSSLAWVHIPVIEIADRTDAGRILKLSAADVSLLSERGIFDTTPRHAGNIEAHGASATAFLGTTRGAYLLKDSAFTRIVYRPRSAPIEPPSLGHHAQ